MDKGGKRPKKKKTNIERNYCNKVHRKRTEQNHNRPFLKRRRHDDRTLSRRNKEQGNFLRRIPLGMKELPDLTKSKPKLNRPLLTGENNDRSKGNLLSWVT